MNMLKSFRKHYWSMGLRKRLIITYFIMMIIMIMIISLYSFTRVTAILQDEATDSANQVVTCVEDYLDYRLTEIQRIGESTLSNPIVLNILRPPGYFPIEKQVNACRDAVDYLVNLQDKNDIYRIRVFVGDGYIYSNENSNVFPITSMSTEQWFRELEKRKINYYISHGTMKYIWNNEQDIVSYILPLFTEDLMKIEGLLSVDVAMSNITNILDSTVLSNSASLLLVDSEGVLITQSGTKTSDEEASRIFELSGNGEWVMDSRDDVFIYKKSVKDTNWYILYRLPAKTVLQASSRFRTELSIILSLVALLALVLTIWGSQISTRRVMSLVKLMSHVQNGDFSVRSEVHTDDDIGKLEENFNYLVESVTELMKQQVEDKDKLQVSEIHLLQSQINPHFLYNTLDLINWRLLELGETKASQTILQLSKFYKISLSSGHSMIKISDEIEHIRLYISIQNHRFKDKVMLHVDCDESMLSCLIPKVTLQPLIENSIIHGIQEKEEIDSGNIWVKGWKEDEKIIITVSDDGVGMAEEAMHAILNHRHDNHYGVWNIHQRIGLLFGKEYGLIYNHRKPNGVVVELSLPVIETIS